MPKHAQPPQHFLRKETTAETKASQYADKDVELTVWQGTWGNSTNHTWQELQELHAHLGALLRDAGQELQPEDYEYSLQLRSGDYMPWFDWDRTQVWGSKDRITKYLEQWLGKEQWHHLQYRVFRRPKAGSVETVAKGTGHDTAPASF